MIIGKSKFINEICSTTNTCFQRWPIFVGSYYVIFRIAIFSFLSSQIRTSWYFSVVPQHLNHCSTQEKTSCRLLILVSVSAWKMVNSRSLCSRKSSVFFARLIPKATNIRNRCWNRCFCWSTTNWLEHRPGVWYATIFIFSTRRSERYPCLFSAGYKSQCWTRNRMLNIGTSSTSFQKCTRALMIVWTRKSGTAAGYEADQSKSKTTPCGWSQRRNHAAGCLATRGEIDRFGERESGTV